MSDEFRNKLRRGTIFLEPLLNIVKKDEKFPRDSFNCPHCKALLSTENDLNPGTYLVCWKCNMTSRLIEWSKSDSRFYDNNHYQVSVAPIN